MTLLILVYHLPSLIIDSKYITILKALPPNTTVAVYGSITAGIVIVVISLLLFLCCCCCCCSLFFYCCCKIIVTLCCNDDYDDIEGRQDLTESMFRALLQQVNQSIPTLGREATKSNNVDTLNDLPPNSIVTIYGSITDGVAIVTVSFVIFTIVQCALCVRKILRCMYCYICYCCLLPVSLLLHMLLFGRHR
jgi:hypothetical protein